MGEMVELRKQGIPIAEIAEIAGVSERRVQQVMRENGMCRDQRPIKEYRVMIMTPEFLTVGAVSKEQARNIARSMYNDNVRVQTVEEL